MISWYSPKAIALFPLWPISSLFFWTNSPMPSHHFLYAWPRFPWSHYRIISSFSSYLAWIVYTSKFRLGSTHNKLWETGEKFHDKILKKISFNKNDTYLLNLSLWYLSTYLQCKGGPWTSHQPCMAWWRTPTTSTYTIDNASRRDMQNSQ